MNNKSLIALTGIWAEDLVFSQWRGKKSLIKGSSVPLYRYLEFIQCIHHIKLSTDETEQMLQKSEFSVHHRGRQFLKSLECMKVSLKLKCCVRVLKFSPEDCTHENLVHSSPAMPCSIVSQSASKHIFLSKHFHLLEMIWEAIAWCVQNLRYNTGFPHLNVNILLNFAPRRAVLQGDPLLTMFLSGQTLVYTNAVVNTDK